ncbi:hypothetical protein Trydic_g16092 [Trypoxylus dichotomus]
MTGVDFPPIARSGTEQAFQDNGAPAVGRTSGLVMEPPPDDARDVYLTCSELSLRFRLNILGIVGAY